MQYAIDKEGIRTHIDQADREQEYFCPVCGEKVLQRHGQKNVHHFYHHNNVCTDNWHYEEMSEWHRGWQECYPEECREVVIGNHRADVLIGKTVIEFQHSRMSDKEFGERSEFYTSAGYKLIWLFDNMDRMPVVPNSYVYTQQEDGLIHRGDEVLKPEEFVEQSDTLGMVYEKLYLIRDIHDEAIYCGCPINKKGYAPRDRYEGITSCDQCEYCLEYGDTVKCTGRFKDYKYPVRLKDNEFIYFDDNGKTRMTYISLAPYPGKSILELTLEYQAKVMIASNLKTGYSFMVKHPLEQYHRNKNGDIYGCLPRPDGRYGKTSRKMYYSNHPDWIVKWFKR